ncbi:MAG: YraN family protein [bacterium]
MASVNNIFSRWKSWDKKPCPILKDHLESGVYGERVAEAFLRRKGYKILARNYETKWGEIDLVCRHQKVLVFVEVKARDEKTLDRPSRAVDASKRRRLMRTAYAYLAELPERDMPTRFDVVEVYLCAGETPRCELLAGAFGSFAQGLTFDSKN